MSKIKILYSNINYKNKKRGRNILKRNIFKSYICKYDNEIENIEKSGIKIIKLISAQPDIKTDESYYNSLNSINEGINAYSDYRGREDLRKEFAKYYNEKANIKKFNCNDIQITLGASDAIISLLITICRNPNDLVILIEPFFSDYKQYCQMLNINYIAVGIENLNNIKLKNNCRAILFSNPNNPTGYIFNKQEINKIISFAKENNLYIISDEVYNEILYEDYISFSNYEYNKIIIVDSVSKKLNNCGARIGCIITKNDEILDKLAMIYDSRISISNIEQIAVLNMLKNRRKIFKNNMEVYSNRKNKIQNFLEKQNIIKYEIPKGGVFFTLTLPIENVEKFTNWLLSNYRKNNETVALLPANNFYINTKNKIRLPMTYNVDYILNGLNLLLDALNKYEKEELK